MSFADLELLWQGVRLEPLLQAICDFPDQQPMLVERVRRDLVGGPKRPDHHGRRGLTASQTLRALVLMRVKNWDYHELRERIADGITLRAFTDFSCEEVPKHDAFKLRLDTTAVESDIHHPTDNTLLGDVVRGASRGSSAGLPKRRNCGASRVFATACGLHIGAWTRYNG